MEKENRLNIVTSVLPMVEDESEYWYDKELNEICCKRRCSADAVARWLANLFNLEIKPVFKDKKWVFEIPE